MTKQRKQAIIATACGIIAALCVFAYTATIQSEASMARASAIRAYGGDRVEVLVASKTIPIGGTIDESNTTTQEWLVDLLPQGQAARSYDELEGMVAQSEIRVNEPVLLERVGDGSSSPYQMAWRRQVSPPMTCLQWVVRFGLARSWTSTSRHRPAKSRCSASTYSCSRRALPKMPRTSRYPGSRSRSNPRA